MSRRLAEYLVAAGLALAAAPAPAQQFLNVLTGRRRWRRVC